MIRNLLLLSLVVVSALAIAKAPTPYCAVRPELKQVPLSLGQQMIVNLDNLFTGYNLDLSLASNHSFALLTKKMTLLDQIDGYFPNIISHYVEHDGNNWGKDTYIMYQDMSGSIIFSYGKIKDQYHIPSVDFTVIVSKAGEYQCFGAALLMDYGLAIVDCAKKQKQSVYMENYWIYIDLATHNITKYVKNPTYVKFTEITKRKTMKFRDIHTGYTYLLRSYPADGVNAEQRHNTYMQVFSVRDPYDIQIMKVLDRTYLHTQKLQIIDVKVYLGDIFMLDFYNGLYRLDIWHNNDVIITGRYIKEGFTKFAVYSDDLENQVLIALANAHAVYQIDWSNIRDPVMINKYSLMEHSHVKQVIINDQFVVVQSAANATSDEKPKGFEIDYTWVFSRGARTYTNAYAVINHNSSKVQLEFNRYHDRLLVADQGGIKLYQISAPMLQMSLGEQGKVGTSEDLYIIASSSDPNVNGTFKCQHRVSIKFVRSDDITIYEEDVDTTSNYSTNYPGQLHVNLDRYVMGPNITYDLINKTAQFAVPTYWVYKVNETNIKFDFGMGDIIFFHTQVVPEFGRERIIYYVQDSRYFTHIIECVHLWEENEVYCHEDGKFAHSSAIQSFTTAFFTDSEGFNYFYIFTFKSTPKVATIVDYSRHQYLMNITYQGHQQADITQLATSNGFLYVLRGAVKTIDVYRLKDCQQQLSCKPDFKIDSDTLKPLGVNYFAPEQLVTDFSHPQVLFIRCRGSIVILDIDNKQNMILLDEIISVSTQNKFYRIAVNKERLVIVSDPDIVDLYTLQHIYIKNQIKFLKRLPLYGHEIQPISDIEFSDVDHLIYINAVDKARNASTVLIYRTNRPAAAALYATIPLRKLYSRPGLEIQVSGWFVDFLNIKTDDGFFLYRVFETPMLVVKDTWVDFKFQIQFKNLKSRLTSELLQIQSVNYPSGFTATAQFNATLKSLKLDHSQNYTWDDRNWFKGNILGYNFTCPECGEDQHAKVHLKEHVDPMATLHLTGYDFAETLFGSVIVNDDLFRLGLNGTVRDVINLPDQKFLERCVKVATAFHNQLIVTACQQLGRGINIYITSQQSFKPWTWGPYRSTAYNARNLQVAGDILALTDTSYYPEYKFEKGTVFLYSLALDNRTGEQMVELQAFDENDFVNAHGFTKNQVHIGNSHLVYTAYNNIYRLYVTEVDGGIFVVDFSHEPGRGQVNVITINYVDVKALLEKNNLHMPVDASFQAITLASYKYNPHYFLQSVIVTVKGYHNLQVVLVFNDDGNIVSSILHRLYYRYGYYNTVNQVKSTSGFVAISYIIPYAYEHSTSSTRQIVAVYDTNDYEGDHQKGYSERYMLGAFRGNRTNPYTFAFNTTYDHHTNGTRIGLIVTNPYEAPSKNMYELSVSHTLQLQVKKNFKDQTLTLIPFSDFDLKSYQIKIYNQKNDDDDDKEKQKEKVIIIVVIVLAVLITVGFTIYICFLIRKKRTVNSQQRTSLLTEDRSVRQSVQPTTADYKPPVPANQDDQSESDESGSGSGSQEQVPVAAPVTTKLKEEPPKVTTPEPQSITVAEKKEEVPVPEKKVENIEVPAQKPVPTPVVVSEPVAQNKEAVVQQNADKPEQK